MQTILSGLHVLVCLFLVVAVLLQHGKGASIGASFGGSSQTVFGTEGPLPMMNKVTTAAAVIFMITSVALAWYSSRVGDGSVMERVIAPPPGYQEVVPERDQPATIPLPPAAAPSEAPSTAPAQE